MNKAIILDMDGVVIDSNPYHRLAWGNFLRQHGIAVNDHVFRDIIFGTTGDQALQLLFANSLTADQINSFALEIDANYRNIISDSGDLVPVRGLIHFLEIASHRGFKLALATSAPPENVNLILSRLGLAAHFNLIIDKTRVAKGKPDPEIYLRTVKELDANKDCCIVFEDSVSGVQAAVRAGIRVVGVTTSHSPEELHRAGTFLNISDFSDPSLPALLTKIQGC
jgi:beta-phosphoglucomutase